MVSPKIDILHRSDFYQIRNYQCNCTKCHTSITEFSSSFNFCFVRSGYFEYQVFKRNLEVHVGKLMISKYGSEHKTHHIDGQPDICSVFDFTNTFYDSLLDHYGHKAKWFFNNQDVQSILLHCTPDIDYLHWSILKQVQQSHVDNMLLDDWVIRLVDKAMNILSNSTDPVPLAANLRRYHLNTVEKAKNYLYLHFNENVTLKKLADHCCISVFHFSRIFKAVMKLSPYQYLNEVRLQHAQILLENQPTPVTQIAFQCGFNSVENFDYAFRQRFNLTPSEFRRRVV